MDLSEYTESLYHKYNIKKLKCESVSESNNTSKLEIVISSCIIRIETYTLNEN